MPSVVSVLVNLLVLGAAVACPALVTYYTQGNVPDLATVAVLCFLALGVFRLLGVPTLVEGLVGTNAQIEKEVSVDEEFEEDEEEEYDEDEESDALDEQDTTATVPSVTEATVSDSSDPYISALPALEAEILSLCDTTKSPSGPPGSDDVDWHTTLTQSWGNYNIEIHKRVGYEFFFRYVMTLEGTPEETFDLMADIRKRPAWDELCQAGDVVERVSNRTVVQYFRTQGMWPTKPRYALVVAFTKLLPNNRYLNVTKSIDSHPKFTPDSGDVCMRARIAGQIVEPDPQGRPRVCRVVQIVDGDLGGWLPKGVVSMVTQKVIPVGMRKANKMLRAIENQKVVSEAISIAEAKPSVQSTQPEGKIEAAQDGSTTAVAPAAKIAVVSTTEKVMVEPAKVNGTVASVSGNRSALIRRSASGRALMAKPNALRAVLNILRWSQPWVIISVLLAVITGRFKR
ncbi:hypothetical protein SpCBS45565_g02659 [Spizellomyces sp. 'palustris']|nr:hypothetical protein SpCBS45565_g02659 [Spizellomyces sp. 'palustris']